MAAGDEALQGYSQSQDPVAQDLKGPSAFDQSHAVMVRFQFAPPSLLTGPRVIRGSANAMASLRRLLGENGTAVHA